jgi:hypothetical protein
VDHHRIFGPAYDGDGVLARKALARLQSFLARISGTFLDLRWIVRRGVSGDLFSVVVAGILFVLSDVSASGAFLDGPVVMGKLVRGPVYRAGIFLPRISGGRLGALHRNTFRSSLGDALHDAAFFQALARGLRRDCGWVRPGVASVEDEIDLGRGWHSLRGGGVDGFDGAIAQGAIALAASLKAPLSKT